MDPVNGAPPRPNPLRARLEKAREVVRGILSANLTPAGIGQAVALGVFVGVVPVYGLHIAICVLLARWLRLNQPLVYAAANISNPLFAPFLILAEIWLGDVVRLGHARQVDLEQLSHLPVWELVKDAPDMAWSAMVGGVLLGVVLGPLLGGLAFWVAWRRQRRAG